jgi:regulator of replication initiation timing
MNVLTSAHDDAIESLRALVRDLKRENRALRFELDDLRGQARSMGDENNRLCDENYDLQQALQMRNEAAE